MIMTHTGAAEYGVQLICVERNVNDTIKLCLGGEQEQEDVTHPPYSNKLQPQEIWQVYSQIPTWIVLRPGSVMMMMIYNFSAPQDEVPSQVWVVMRSSDLHLPGH